MQELDRIRDKQGGCPTGSAVVTGAGNLPAKYVIHAVGPVYRDGKHGEPDLLASCYRTAFELAEARKAQSMSFPAISTGVYGYPVREAARIALREIAAHLNGEGSVGDVAMVLFDERSYQAHVEALAELSSPAQTGTA